MSPRAESSHFSYLRALKFSSPDCDASLTASCGDQRGHAATAADNRPPSTPGPPAQLGLVRLHLRQHGPVVRQERGLAVVLVRGEGVVEEDLPGLGAVDGRRRRRPPRDGSGGSVGGNNPTPQINIKYYIILNIG